MCFPRCFCLLSVTKSKNQLEPCYRLIKSTKYADNRCKIVSQILEAITTERCNEHFSLERLEVLGDAFLKFSVGRHLFLLHEALDEGQLTRKRSNLVNNSNLLKLATMRNVQVSQFYFLQLVTTIYFIPYAVREGVT